MLGYELDFVPLGMIFANPVTYICKMVKVLNSYNLPVWQD